jgi:hypothetical protein
MPDYTANIKDIPELVANINEQLRDNNAGAISAKNVRETMRDVANSIRHIVASGQWEEPELRFTNNIHIKTTTNPTTSVTTGGLVIVESGIQFDNEIGNGAVQVHPYPGPQGISHNNLADTGTGDDHAQYFHMDGRRSMQGDFKLDNYSISSSGYANHGFSFEYHGPDSETLVIGNETDIKFASDNTKISTARSTAQAWLNFNSVSGSVGNTDTVAIHSSYNISKVERLRESNGDLANGKFRIYFKAELFENATDYVAFGESTGRNGYTQGSDFANGIKVGIVDRDAESLTFYVLDDNGDYTDAYYNDLVVFGNPSGTASSDPAVVIDWAAAP